MEYYQLLGLQKDASEKDIKKAYREKAKELHPDRNPGDKKAEELFKRVSEAYSVLSDPEKRSSYDMYGKDGLSSGAHHDPFAGFTGGFTNFSDIFESFFGGGQQGASLDIFEEVTLSVKELIHGAVKSVTNLNRSVECQPCQGKGASPGTKASICPDCHGHGTITRNMGMMTFAQTCTTCGGVGSYIKHPCESCKGRGTVVDRTPASVKIPYGLRPGQSIRVPQGGHRTLNAEGDLYLKINVNTSEYKISGDNLHTVTAVNCLVACAGGSATVNTVDGEKTFNVPPGVQQGSKIRLKKLGLPKSPTNPDRGDLIVTLNLTVPELTDKQKESIENILSGQ